MKEKSRKSPPTQKGSLKKETGSKIQKKLALLILLFMSLSCSTERYLQKGEKWLPMAAKARPPLQINVEKPPEPLREFSLRGFLEDCRKEADGRVTKFYRCSFQDAQALQEIIQKTKSPKGSYYLHKPTNTLVITDTIKGMERIGKTLGQLDIPSPQVRIRVRVVELIRNRQWEHGIDYNQNRSTSIDWKSLKGIQSVLEPKNYMDSQKPGANSFQGTALSFLTGGKSFGAIDVVVRLFQELGSASVDASPDLLVSEGKTAKIMSGEEVPFITTTVNNGQIFYSTQFKPVGVSMQVRPELIDYKGVRLYVKSEVSMVTSWTDPSLVGGVSNPIVSTRATETTIMARNGEIFLFGGLLSKRKMMVRRSVPILGDIPVLGYLFSSTRYESTDSHLTFLLSVEVVTPVKQKESAS